MKVTRVFYGSRTSRGGLLLAMLLTISALVLNAGIFSDTYAQSAISDIFVDEEVDLGDVEYEPLSGFTGYGANVGLLKMYGGDGTKDTKARPILQATFKYRFSDDWIGLGEFGFAWNSFSSRQDTVLAVSFGTLGMLREFSGYKGMTWRAGGGLGMYRWNYKEKGKSIRDLESQQFYRGFVPGVMLGLEAESRVARHVTLTGSIQNHYIFAADEKFDSLFDSNFSAVGFRIGAHYHFSPYEGILWERKEKKSIRLSSKG